MEDEFEQYLAEVRDLLEANDRSRLREILDMMRIQDIAHLLMKLDREQIPEVFGTLPRGRKVDVFSYLEPAYQYRLLDRIHSAEARHILSEMLPDDLTALLEVLPEEDVRRLLRLLPFRTIRRALTQLGYPDNSVGRLMTLQLIAVRADWSIEESLDYIRTRRNHAESASVIFVTDEERHLVASVPLQRFIHGHADDPVESLTSGPVISINATADRTEAARMMQHYDLEMLPVTDDDDILLGVVTVDDVLDVVEQEATEDFHRIGGVGAVGLSLRDARPSLLYRKRIGWLLVLVFFNLIGGIAIARQEALIEALVVLVFFLPLIIASGGNAGAQSATLMIRALATGDVHMKDWFRLLGKELLVAVSLGLTLAVAVSLLGLWRGGMDIAQVVALTMVTVVIASSMIGMLLPIVLTRVNMDPATASGPLVTSVADIVGILIYFGIAVSLLHLPPP